MPLVVVTGGARSGKSAVAQQLAVSSGLPVTVVVFGREDGDAEMAARIERHRAERPSDWRTMEAPSGDSWPEAVGEGVVLLDCVGTMVGRLMEDAYRTAGGGAFDQAGDLPAGLEAEVETRLEALLGTLCERSGPTIVVTNEVGQGVVPAFATGRVFRDVLGRANRFLVDRADAAYLVVAGRCLSLSDLPQSATWPRMRGVR